VKSSEITLFAGSITIFVAQILVSDAKTPSKLRVFPTKIP
jgi:hypothetical protein